MSECLFLNHYKDQNMYNKAVDNYPYEGKFVPDCYKA